MKTLKVGQTVYLRDDRKIRSSDEIFEATVSKVGRKYFEIEDVYGKFDIEKMWNVTDLTPHLHVRLSRQEIVDENEMCKLNRIIKEYIGARIHKLSLQQLRKIYEIIVVGEEAKNEMSIGKDTQRII